ncbi:MAG: Gfo/Idh/MocA family protein [Planctomycetota bacterium]
MAGHTIGFVGTTAPHSFMFLDTLRLIPETVGRIALVEAEAERIAKARADAVYPDVEAMLAAERPDVCFIMRRTDQAEEPAIRCAEAGVPIVIDKHCTHTSDALRRILAACGRSGVGFSTCYTWRYSPAAVQIRDWVAQGLLGRLYGFDIRMVTTSAVMRLGDPQFAWLFDRAKSGGGILIWLACHFLDLVRFILQQEVVAVAAMTARLTEAASTVEDVASVSLELEGGAVGSLHSAYVMPGGFATNYHTDFGIWGDLGDVRWSPIVGGFNPTVRVRSQHPEWAGEPEQTLQYEDELAPQAYGGTRFVVDFFLDMVERLAAGAAPPVTGQDALRVLAICEAAYRSAEKGRRIAL